MIQCMHIQCISTKTQTIHAAVKYFAQYIRDTEPVNTVSMNVGQCTEREQKRKIIYIFKTEQK